MKRYMEQQSAQLRTLDISDLRPGQVAKLKWRLDEIRRYTPGGFAIQQSFTNAKGEPDIDTFLQKEGYNPACTYANIRVFETQEEATRIARLCSELNPSVKHSVVEIFKKSDKKSDTDWFTGPVN